MNDLKRGVGSPNGFYDEKEKKYMVYYSLQNKDDYLTIYYSYANSDFTVLSEPKKW